MDVEHDGWGYTGRCDTVEVLEGGSLRVIEYKSTPVRRRAEVTEAMRMQLALQVAALEACGHAVSGRLVYFTEHRQRVAVELTPDDFDAARRLVDSTRATLESGTAPPPLEDDARCTRCSHAAVCLPDERELQPVRRRIVVADPDTQVVHLTTPGARASLRSGRLIVRKGDDELSSVPLERVQGLVVHGNVDLSGALIRELLWRRLSIVWCTGRGRVTGWASSTDSPNGAARQRQHAAQPGGDLLLAREIVGAKITNQATLLRRNGDGANEVARLRGLARLATTAGSVSALYGIEGEAASLYFDRFETMLRPADITFSGRSRRPAHDPVNAALNYAYSLLLGDCIRALRSCGLDPHVGVLHSSNRNKPALALDLLEEFRAPVADSVVIRAFNNGELGPTDFRSPLGESTLTERGRKALIAAYERRVLGEMTHPTFGYRVTWRRAMEIQARLILGVFDGSQPSYVGIRTR
ncbi:CRISPR-associated endonuclease Cas1 [Cellulomonas soli]